jgi:glucose-1-phosphate adenylyltransferase
VINSLLSPNVRVDSFAVVEDSILMDGVHVDEGAQVKRAIIDKQVHIPPGVKIGGNLRRDRKRFTVTDSGVVVVPKGMEVD